MYGIMASETSKDKIQAQIEENLKRVYDDALNEPVPARFQALLDQLRQQDKQKEPKA
jgi:hypothetical protein